MEDANGHQAFGQTIPARSGYFRFDHSWGRSGSFDRRRCWFVARSDEERCAWQKLGGDVFLNHFDPVAQGVEGERAMLQNTRITKRIALEFGMIVGLMLVLSAAGY